MGTTFSRAKICPLLSMCAGRLCCKDEEMKVTVFAVAAAVEISSETGVFSPRFHI